MPFNSSFVLKAVTSSPLTIRRPGRSSSVVVHAGDKFARDVISLPKQPGELQIEGESDVSFLGAGGQEAKIVCRKDTYILNAAIEQGVELPYTCQSGICGSCVVRMSHGEVDMSDIADLSFTLTDDEVAQGMVLTCMARPVSDTVVMETQSDWGYSLGITEWQGATGEIKGKNVEPLMGEKWTDFRVESDDEGKQQQGGGTQ